MSEASKADRSWIARGAGWPVLIVALLLLNVSVVTVTVLAATRDRSFHVVDGYDRKAEQFDATRREREAMRARLGWRLTAGVSGGVAPGLTRIGVQVRDKQGRGVTDAVVVVTAVHGANPNDSRTIELTHSDADGLYEAQAALPYAGRWHLSVSARRGGDEVIEDVVRETY